MDKTPVEKAVATRMTAQRRHASEIERMRLEMSNLGTQLNNVQGDLQAIARLAQAIMDICHPAHRAKMHFVGGQPVDRQGNPARDPWAGMEQGDPHGI